MHKLGRAIVAISHRLWRLLNFTRVAIQNLLFIGMVVFTVTLIIRYHSINTEERLPLLKPTALIVDIQGRITDDIPLNQQHRGWIQKWIARSPVVGNSLFEICSAIRQAKQDAHIKGIILSLQNFEGANQPALHYIGKALREFRDSGKSIYAFGDSYTPAQYYLASFATTISLAPQGSIDLHGMAQENLYYRSLLEKLKVSTHVFRVGTYKSAVEPFLRDGMSPVVRADAQQRLQDLWSCFIEDIAVNRQLASNLFTPTAARYLEDLQKLQGDHAQYALQHQWVDQLVTAHEHYETLLTFFGTRSSSKRLNAVSIYDYRPPLNEKTTTYKIKAVTPDKIAVVVANGTLVYGVAKPGAVGSETTVKLLRQVHNDQSIKAVLLHMNSPGGSVQASEAIRSEIVALRRAGKAVVVSMGGAAASGGYWVASAADYIVANPTTITGSIGIFGIINTFENTLNQIGVHADGVTTSPLVDASLSRGLSLEIKQLIQSNIDNGYQQFINLVAEARGKTVSEIEPLAQGRVWLGQAAYQQGLVDQLGDFDDALVKTAELAQLKQYRLAWLAPQPSEWLEYLLGVDQARDMRTLIASLSKTIPQQLLNQAQSNLFPFFNDPQGRYAFCFHCHDN
ncbi:MAG: signal peptide peptidase SppA [Candidatus Symbiodolus clandestinus]